MTIGMVLLVIYGLCMVYITIYCLAQLHLSYHYFKSRKKTIPKQKEIEAFPFVTIQLPIFNEWYVVERLIDNIAKQDYPKDCYEIQVLDDSTDETIEISRRKVGEYKSKGFNIELIHRIDRKGYKAGALDFGLKTAKGEFVAIFDADFLPEPDFLRTTISAFKNEKIGAVQTRWGHLNKDYSLITKLQAFHLDAHFTVEQKGRNSAGYCINFNGTAGVWRVKTISDAGGWHADTLTEDLDLSYRAQIKGWQFKYMEEYISPAELPAEMNALKSQQFRWTKGGAETAKKMIPSVWKSDLTFMQKIHGSFHLLSSSVFIFILLSAIISVPLLFFKSQDALLFEILKYGGIFFLGLISIIIVYFFANRNPKDSALKTLMKVILVFPVFLSFSMGLSLHNAIAVLEGLIGKKSEFIRTPKFNIMNKESSFSDNKYIPTKINWVTIFEGILALYFLSAIGMGIYLNDLSFVPYHGLLFIGFFSIAFLSVKHKAS